MRMYSFTNFYLSSIQQGIQPAHCISEMFVKYNDETRARDILFDWATSHKTMICLNGGNSAGVRAVWEQLITIGMATGLPFVKFHEDADSLDGISTACAIIVPARVYDVAAALRKAETFDVLSITAGLTSAEVELAMLLNNYSLAK